MTVYIDVKTNSRTQMLDITPLIRKEISRSGIKEGICTVYIPHTTAGITINEGADPSVCYDIIYKLSELVPPDAGYRHMEGNSDSHIKASLMGSSVSVIVEDGRLVLGPGQKIFSWEFTGPRSRKVLIRI